MALHEASTRADFVSECASSGWASEIASPRTGKVAEGCVWWRPGDLALLAWTTHQHKQGVGNAREEFSDMWQQCVIRLIEYMVCQCHRQISL